MEDMAKRLRMGCQDIHLHAQNARLCAKASTGNRAAFERWLRQVREINGQSEYTPVRTTDGGYENNCDQAAWLGWQDIDLPS